ncbi:MAG: N-acetyltransferase family protein [Candidatus Sericytochromatia bacterium]
MLKNDASMSVRSATAEDYPRVLRLIEQGDKFHQAGRPDIFAAYQGVARTEDYFAGLVSDDDTAFLVASRPPDIIGYIHATLKRPDTPGLQIFVKRSYVAIQSIVVDEAFQDMGIGRMLMDQAQRWAESKGAETIELNVFEFNHKALQFYLKMGYVTMSRKLEMRLPQP